MILATLLALGLLDLTIEQRVSIEPATITGKARILPRPENREACVTLYLEGERIDQSCWTLNGDNEAAYRAVKWMRLRAGEYLAVLSVRTTTGISDKAQGFTVSP